MKIACFGAGQIGSAFIRGVLKSQIVRPENLLVKGGKSGTAEALQAELGFRLVRNVADLTDCDVVCIATIPSVIPSILKELKGNLGQNTIVLSLATSPSIAVLQSALGSHALVARAIPNTPIQVLAGMTGVSYGKNCQTTHKETVQTLLGSLGQALEVPEEKLGIFGTVAGCGPAFVDVFIEALADASVLNGLSRKEAYKIVLQMIQGAATLAQESQTHPAVLKDQVCSPGGSTIRGVAALEENGFRNAVIQAITKANIH